MVEENDDVQTQAMRAAVALFARQGFEQTTVEQVADATGISRATFFRRYRSKEDVVFADHERLLATVRKRLAAEQPVDPVGPEIVTRAPSEVVCDQVRALFDHNVRLGAASVARQRLIQQVPALRDRQLATANRYQVAFLDFLRDVLPPEQAAAPTTYAFAASVIALQDAMLRQWLRDTDRDLGPTLDRALADIAARLIRPMSAPAHRRSATLIPGTGQTDSDHIARVVVTVIDGPADPESIGSAVSEALREING